MEKCRGTIGHLGAKAGELTPRRQGNKRSLGDLPAAAITVVEWDPARRPAPEHPVGQNYIKIFGQGLDWHPEGFADFSLNRQP